MLKMLRCLMDAVHGQPFTADLECMLEQIGEKLAANAAG